MIDALKNLPKEALLSRMEEAYSDAKPMQDAMADKAVEILTLSAEVFRRVIVKHLPDVPFARTRIVARLNCSLNCLGDGAFQLNRRLNKFREEGVEIVKIEFDEILNEYAFHAAPENEGAP